MEIGVNNFLDSTSRSLERKALLPRRVSASMKKRVFISFDYDNDRDLPGNLVHQAKQHDSPFSMVDLSLKVSVESKWKKEVRARIRKANLVIVICGKHTDVAKGVAAELSIAQEENKRYFLLRGRRRATCKKPPMARKSDEMHEWTWENLARLIAGVK